MNSIQPIENVNFDLAEVNQLIFAVKMYLLRFKKKELKSYNHILTNGGYC